MDRTLTRRVAAIAGLVSFTLFFGTAGFAVIAGYPVFDAFYMTLITISTVGYQEIHPLTQAGRIFNSVLILVGVTVMFFAVGIVTQTVLELGLQDRFGRRRRKRLMDKLQNHFIVCGYGRVGRNASVEILRAGVPLVVIDRNEARTEQAQLAGALALTADSTRDDTLRAAGITRARGLISALATDADNLFVILSAKTLNPKLTVVTRASEEEAEEKLRRAGADTVFAPFSMTGHRLAHALLRPHVSTFLDSATMTMGLDVNIEQVQVGSKAVYSKSLKELHLNSELGVIVLAIREAGGRMRFNPPAETVLSEGDYLIAMGATENLQKLENLVARAK
jgi:voltage-gated potassium channel